MHIYLLYKCTSQVIYYFVKKFIFHQVLASLKHKIDQFLSQHNNVDILVEQARLFLINREDKLVNARKNVLEAAAHSAPPKRNSLSGEPFLRGMIYFPIIQNRN